MEGWNLDVDAQRRRYASGFKGGPFNVVPYTPPKMTVVDPVPDSVKQNFMGQKPEQMTITDTWYGRRTAKN